MNSVERPLSSRETFSVEKASPVVAGWTFRGVVEPSILGRAAAVLAAEYPTLQGRVVRNADGWWLRADQSRPLTVAVRHADGDPLRAELNLPWLPEHGIARVVLADHGTHRTLMLAVDHAFSDGRSVLSLLGKLWGYYTDLVRGAPKPSPPVVNGCGVPVEHLLAGRFTEAEIESAVDHAGKIAGQLAQLQSGVLPARGAGRSAHPASVGVLSMRLDEDETRRIVAAAGTHGISVHALLTGILLAAVRPLIPNVAGPALLLAFHGVDLRSRIDPWVPAELLADYTSGTASLIPVDSDAQPAELGRMVATQLRAALGSDDLYKQPLIEGRLDVSSELAGAFMLSNLGVVESPRVPNGITPTGLRFLTGQNLNATPYLFASTACGRLGLDLAYRRAQHHDDQMAELRDGIVSGLRSVARQLRFAA